MDRALNFKIDAENYVERRCCGKYKVWVPAQPESRVADKIDKHNLQTGLRRAGS